ncbi:MAG: hypothetical protein GXY92_04575 [Syntrophomonadaceae bacterium]|nr:hypothetical protein [Syntrophomonadaceae bacterium]
MGTVKGVDLAVNPVVVLLCLICLSTGTAEILWIILALVLHEAGHVLAACACGLKLLRVELFPFGGQILTEDLVGLNWKRDILAASAGPAASLFSSGLTYIMERNLSLVDFSFFMEFNLLLGLFNLLPALPLDGGRILKAFCSTRVGLRKATVIGSWSGQVLALILFAAGLFLGFQDPRAFNLLLIAGFLGYKAREELQMIPYAFTRYLLHKRLLPAENDMADGILTVAHSGVAISRILHRILPDNITVVLVIDGQGKVIGIVTERVLIEAMLTRDPLTTVGELLEPTVRCEDRRK